MMNRKISTHLESIFPEMPTGFEKRIDADLDMIRTNAGVGRRSRQKGGFRFTKYVAAACALLLLTTGTAYAISTGLIDRIFGQERPSQEAIELLQEGQSAVQNDVTFSVDNYLYDGNKLYLEWSVTSTNKDALYFAVDYPTISDSKSWAGSSSNGGMEKLYALKEGETLSGYYDCDMSVHNGIGFPIDVQLKCYVFSAMRDITPCDSDDVVINQCLADDGTLLYATSGKFISLYGHAAADIMSQNASLTIADAYEQLGYAQVENVIPITLTLENYEEGQTAESKSFAFDGYRIEICEAKQTPASLYLKFRLYADNVADLEESGTLQRKYIMTDMSGNEVFDGVVGGCEWGLTADENDAPCLEYIFDWYPKSQMPSEYQLVPLNADGAALWEEAFVLGFN